MFSTRSLLFLPTLLTLCLCSQHILYTPSSHYRMPRRAASSPCLSPYQAFDITSSKCHVVGDRRPCGGENVFLRLPANPFLGFCKDTTEDGSTTTTTTTTLKPSSGLIHLSLKPEDYAFIKKATWNAAGCKGQKGKLNCDEKPAK